MIVSVHIPKTAGTSFGEELAQIFPGRVVSDYGDWPEILTDEARVRREQRRTEMLAAAGGYGRRYDAIHGHFAATKYLGAFPATSLVTFVRDPFQQAVSMHAHAMRIDVSEHPAHHSIKDAELTAAALVELFPNFQSLYFDGIPLEQFTMVGLSERYETSLELFGAVFGVAVPGQLMRTNVNPDRPDAMYEVTDELRQAVQLHHAADLKLYRRACERFDVMCAAYGVG